MRFNPYVAVIIAATIGGFHGVFIKFINLPPTTYSFFRVFIPVVVLLGYFTLTKKQFPKGNYTWMIIASIFNAIRIFLYIFAFLYTSVGTAVIILFTWPIFAFIFGVIFLKEKMTKRNLLLILLAFVGVIVINLNNKISFQSNDFIGIVAMLGSAILFSLSMIIFKKELKHYSKTQTIFFQNLIGAIVFLPFIFVNQPYPTLPEISLATGMAFLVGVISFTLFFYGLKHMSMSHYSLLTYWEVIAAVFFGAIFFKEAITVYTIIGGLLIIIAGLLLRKKEFKTTASQL